MKVERRCFECWAPIPADVEGQLCPDCLLMLGWRAPHGGCRLERETCQVPPARPGRGWAALGLGGFWKRLTEPGWRSGARRARLALSFFRASKAREVKSRASPGEQGPGGGPCPEVAEDARVRTRIGSG